MAYTYTIQGQFETCQKRLDGNMLLCMVDLIKQDTKTGEIELLPTVIEVPADMLFVDAIAAFEREKARRNSEGI